jgi:3-hydroxy acid dehydrogenase/malonic semialdehyde reductase
LDLAGKSAIVTGASSGIGAATVQRLRDAGARVVGGARRVERIEADVALPLDVTDEESAAAFVWRAVAELGGIDILFNNAGLALGRYPFWESTLEDEATVLHTNVDGAIRVTRLCLPHVRDGGHILFMGSVAGRQAYQNAASYVAAKFAVRGFVYALREDLLGRPIRITTVDAGLTETEFSLVRFRGDAEAAKAVYEGVDPLTPGDVADCVLFAVTRPLHVNVDEIVVKALAQSSGGRIRPHRPRCVLL